MIWQGFQFFNDLAEHFHHFAVLCLLFFVGNMILQACQVSVEFAFVKLQSILAELFIPTAERDCQIMVPVAFVFGETSNQHVVPCELRHAGLTQVVEIWQFGFVELS